MEHNIMGIDPCDSQNHAIFNATTQKRNIVDPRTGLFEAYVPLPSVTGNAGAGPVIDTSLYYTPVVNNAAGLGDGWSFAFTHYHQETQQLTLHSGEVLRMERGVDLKHPAVIATWYKGKLTVLRRDGRAEVLIEIGTTKIFMPETLTTDGYNFLTLGWSSTAHTIGEVHHQIQLTQIKDATRVLLKVEYPPAQGEKKPVTACAKIIFWPDAPEKMTFDLALEDYALKSVTAADGTTSTFEYQDHARCGWLLNGISSFQGLKEKVVYEDNGLKFEGNHKLSELPCVSFHTLTSRGGGAEVKTHYSYDRVDNKNYSTTVRMGAATASPTQQEASDNSVRKTVYKYDEHHEMVQEMTTQGGASVIKQFEEQSGVISSERSTTVTYQKDNKFCKKTVRNVFGSNAEFISNVQGDQCTEWYHSISGSGGSLGKAQTVFGIVQMANAGGLRSGDYRDMFGSGPDYFRRSSVGLRYLGRKYNASDDFASKYLEAEVVRRGASVEKMTTYIEKELSGLKGPTIEDCTSFKYYDYEEIKGLSENKISYTLQIINAAQDMTKAACVVQEIKYFNEDDFRKGRQKIVTQDSANHEGDFLKIGEPARTFDYTLDGTQLTTTTTKIDAQGNKRSGSETHSILDGRLISQVDEDGNRADYGYDAYGRLSTHTTCAQSPTYKQTTIYAYPSVGRLEVTEPNGVKHASEYDGQDNLIKEYLQTPENDEWRLVLEVSYDKLGRELRTTRHDYLGDGTQVSEWYELKYDAWNEECGRLHSDGREIINEYDPVAKTRTERTGSTADQHGKVTTYNDDETVAKIEWKDTDGKVYQTQSATYTPAGQVAELQTAGEFGTVTIKYTYDGIGRLLSEQYTEKGKAQGTEEGKAQGTEEGKAQGTAALTYTYHYRYPEHWLISEAMQIDIEFGGVRRTLGKRSFDSWGRVRSLTRGTSTETFAYSGASKVPTSKHTAEGTTLSYEYIKELGYRLSKVSAAGGSEKSFTYSYGAKITSTAGEGERLLSYDHDLHAQLSKQRAQTQTAVAREAQSTYSSGGRLLSETDVQGNTVKYDYNNLGQRTKTASGDLHTTHDYSFKGLLREEIITQGQASLTVSYGYDTRQRETFRTFKFGDKVDLTLKRTYNANNSLKSIQLKKGDVVLGARDLAYTEGGRLASCVTTGVWRPKNPKNKDIDSQAFTYDVLGNISTCITQFGTESCISTYTYDGASGCRLEKVEHSHSDYTQSATLSYDSAGRVTRDQKGKTYSYDWLGRMTQAGSTNYTYDATDRLMTRGQGEGQRQIIYDGLQARGEYRPGAKDTFRHLSPGSAACIVQQIKRSGVNRTLFELCDVEGTVLVSYDVQAETLRHHAYTAYGEHFSEEKDSLLGFNGEYRDAENDQYPLGQGYRWYAPDSQQFHVQDGLSPFGEGGPNAYGYCNGDPANRQDPSGHIGSGAVQKGLRLIWGDSLPRPLNLGKYGFLISTILWSTIGVMTAVMTGGASLWFSAAMIGLAVAAAAAAITAVVIADTHPELAAILGWVSLGLTVFGGVATLLKKVGQLALYLGRSGMVVAKKLFDKGTASFVSTLKRLNLYRGSGKLPAQIIQSGTKRTDRIVTHFIDDAMIPYEKIPFDGKSLIRAGGAAQLFDVGDANTVICCVTGVLGNLGVFESERDNFVNSNINNATWLPWGQFNIGRR